MKLFLVLICFLTIPSFAQSGGRIEGTVTDKHVPIAGATVILKTNEIEIGRATTNTEGKFSFENIKNGEYQVSVVGHENTSTQRMVARGTGTSATFSISVASVRGDRRRVKIGT